MSGNVTTGHHWPTVPLENDMFDALPRFGEPCSARIGIGLNENGRAGSDDQRYRAPFAECAVDALQWNGTHIARRQVIDPA